MAGIVRVALVVPVSGTLGLIGPGAVNCAALAAREINEAGGILGRTVDLRLVDGGRPAPEVALEVRALVRRGHNPIVPERLTAGTLVLDTRGRRVWVRDREVSLTAKEYALLEYFARHAGNVVTRADIAEHVWDEHYDPVSNVVDVYVQRLRRKLDAPGAESSIRTRRGPFRRRISHEFRRN